MSFSGGCTMTEAGSKTSRPSMAMLGLMPVTGCGVIRYAASSAGRRSGQDSGCSSIEVRSICRIVRFARSVWPSDRGWNGVVRVLLFIPVIEQSSATNLLSKLLPGRRVTGEAGQSGWRRRYKVHACTFVPLRHTGVLPQAISWSSQWRQGGICSHPLWQVGQTGRQWRQGPLVHRRRPCEGGHEVDMAAPC